MAKLVAKSHPHVASGFFPLPWCPAMAPVPRSPKAHTARASRGETPCPGAGATERSTERCHGAALGGLRSFLSLRRLVEIVRSVFRILWVNPMGKPPLLGNRFQGFPGFLDGDQGSLASTASAASAGSEAGAGRAPRRSCLAKKEMDRNADGVESVWV